jgi:hypothetical protein
MVLQAEGVLPHQIPARMGDFHYQMHGTKTINNSYRLSVYALVAIAVIFSRLIVVVTVVVAT